MSVVRLANMQTEAQPEQIISACMLCYKEVGMSPISVLQTVIQYRNVLKEEE